MNEIVRKESVSVVRDTEKRKKKLKQSLLYGGCTFPA